MGGRIPTVAGLATIAAVVLGGCSDDGAVVDLDGGAPESTEIASYVDVRPEISPAGYAALGCSIHTALSEVDPSALINRNDPTQAAYQASTSLLVAAGVWNSEAYGSLVEHAQTLLLNHDQGEWDAVAEARNELTLACREVGTAPLGAHVYAAYACGIAGHVAETAPEPRDIAADRLTPTEDEIDALTHLARAATAEERYRQLARRTERLHLTRVDQDLRESYPQRLQQVGNTCGQLG